MRRKNLIGNLFVVVFLVLLSGCMMSYHDFRITNKTTSDKAVFFQESDDKADVQEMENDFTYENEIIIGNSKSETFYGNKKYFIIAAKNVENSNYQEYIISENQQKRVAKILLNSTPVYIYSITENRIQEEDKY